MFQVSKQIFILVFNGTIAVYPPKNPKTSGSGKKAQFETFRRMSTKRVNQ